MINCHCGDQLTNDYKCLLVCVHRPQAQAKLSPNRSISLELRNSCLASLIRRRATVIDNRRHLHHYLWRGDFFMQTRLTYLSFMVNKKMCVSFFVQYICHNSSAVTCAKLWPDLIMISEVKATLFFFTRFGLWAHKPFVKGVLGTQGRGTWKPSIRNHKVLHASEMTREHPIVYGVLVTREWLSQHCDCWSPGATWHQAISSHNADMWSSNPSWGTWKLSNIHYEFYVPGIWQGRGIS